MVGTCPECDENIDLSDDSSPGDFVECPRCHTRLELINTAPVEIDYAPAEDLT